MWQCILHMYIMNEELSDLGIHFGSLAVIWWFPNMGIIIPDWR